MSQRGERHPGADEGEVNRMQELLQITRGWLESEAPLSHAGLIAALVCTLWAGGLATWLVLRLARRGVRKANFRDLATQRDFDRDDARSLWLLGRFTRSKDRQEILMSRQVFDRCVDEAREAAGDDLLAWPEFLSASRISSFRRKFRSTTRRTRHNLKNTHEVEHNQPVTVRLSDGASFKSFILDVTQNELHLTLPNEARLRNNIASDRQVLVSFGRPEDAKYEFASRVSDKTNQPHGSFPVAHASLNRVQNREHVRVRCRSEARFVQVDKQTAESQAMQDKLPEPFRRGTLRDLSLGGASFFGDTELSEGSWILLRIELTREPWSLVVPAQVLRQAVLCGTSRPLLHTYVRYVPLSARGEYHLGRFIADTQQRLIRRLRVRATGTEGYGPPSRPQPEEAEKTSADTEMNAHRQGDELTPPPANPNAEGRQRPNSARSASTISGGAQKA